MIQPFVEGRGDDEAIRVLLMKLLNIAGHYSLPINKPIRRNRDEYLDKDKLRKSLEIGLLRPECKAILILFDADDACPKEIAPCIEKWANEFSGARSVPSVVIMANKEYEAWFLAAIETMSVSPRLRRPPQPFVEPENVRDAKGKFEEFLTDFYSARTDQAKFTAAMDLKLVYQRSRSFRRLVKAFGILLNSQGILSREWPPADWIQPSEADS